MCAAQRHLLVPHWEVALLLLQRNAIHASGLPDPYASPRPALSCTHPVLLVEMGF